MKQKREQGAVIIIIIIIIIIRRRRRRRRRILVILIPMPVIITIIINMEEEQLRSLISKRNISKNTKMELTLDSYIKFNVESVSSVHSSQNSFLTPPK